MAMMFILVLVGAFFWGINNILRKHFLNKAKEENIYVVDEMVVGTMLGAGIFSIIVQFATQGPPKISEGFWIPFLITAVLNIGIQYLGVKATDIGNVSIVAALQSITPILTVASSWIILKESPTILGLI